MAEKELIKKLQKDVNELTRDVFLAGLGLFSTAREEGEKLWERFVQTGQELVKKGEELQKKGTQLTSEKKEELTKEVSTKMEETVKFVEQKLSATIEGTVKALGVPSRSEIQELSARVDRLTKRVAELSRKLETAKKASSESKAKTTASA